MLDTSYVPNNLYAGDYGSVSPFMSSRVSQAGSYFVMRQPCHTQILLRFGPLVRLMARY